MFTDLQVILITLTNVISVIFLGCFCISMIWVFNFRKKFFAEYAVFRRIRRLRSETDYSRKESQASSGVYGDSGDSGQLREQTTYKEIKFNETPFTRQAKRSLHGGIAIYDQLFSTGGFQNVTDEQLAHRTKSYRDIQDVSQVEGTNSTETIENNKHIDLNNISRQRQTSLEEIGKFQQEQDRWKSEKYTVHSLVYFNSLLIVYNMLFLLYALMAVTEAKHEYLITFLPVLQFGQSIIILTFTMNYYRLARVMKIYFTKNLRKQLEQMTKQSIRRHKLKVWAVIGFVYCLSFSTCLCRVKGYSCLTTEYEERPEHPNKQALDYCK